MRLVAVAGNSCLTIRSLIVLLTICWLLEVRSLSTLAQKEVSESCRCLFGRSRLAKQPKRRLCWPL